VTSTMYSLKTGNHAWKMLQHLHLQRNIILNISMTEDAWKETCNWTISKFKNIGFTDNICTDAQTRYTPCNSDRGETLQTNKRSTRGLSQQCEDYFGSGEALQTYLVRDPILCCSLYVTYEIKPPSATWELALRSPCASTTSMAS
jgi:hypothetical protein